MNTLELNWTQTQLEKAFETCSGQVNQIKDLFGGPPNRDQRRQYPDLCEELSQLMTYQMFLAELLVKALRPMHETDDSVDHNH